MYRGLMARLGLAGLACAAAGPASAFVWWFDDPMDGLQEVPPVQTPAHGRVYGTYDDVTNMLHVQTWAVSFLGTVTMAHLHGPAPAGSNAGVVAWLTGATGANSYSSNDQFVLTETQESWLMGGLIYANIHTTAFPGGEVRGQIYLVPEPVTLAGLGLGLSVLALLRRRQSR